MREMRRKDRALSREETAAVLKAGEYAVIATKDADGQPYAVPLSYVWLDEKIVIHCAHDGRKTEAFKADDRVSLTVVTGVEAVYDNGFSTYYNCAMAFGRMVEVTGEDDKRRALLALAEKYLPAHLDKADDNISRLLKRTAVYALEVESLSGKAKKK